MIQFNNRHLVLYAAAALPADEMRATADALRNNPSLAAVMEYLQLITPEAPPNYALPDNANTRVDEGRIRRELQDIVEATGTSMSNWKVVNSAYRNVFAGRSATRIVRLHFYDCCSWFMFDRAMDVANRHVESSQLKRTDLMARLAETIANSNESTLLSASKKPASTIAELRGLSHLQEIAEDDGRVYRLARFAGRAPIEIAELVNCSITETLRILKRATTEVIVSGVGIDE